MNIYHEILIWLARRAGFKSKLHSLKCSVCETQSFTIDSYLYFDLEYTLGSSVPTLELDLEMSDAVIICRRCDEELKIKNPVIEIIKILVTSREILNRLQ